MTIKELIERISYIRNEKNISARELSLRIGKHQGYISKLEVEDFNLSTPMLLKIIEALEIDEGEFFCKLLTKDNKSFLEKYNKLSDANKQTINDLIDTLLKK